MKLPFLPPPSTEELEGLPLHELIRDYPELSGLIEFEEGREGEGGYERLPSSLLDRARELLAWRGGGGE